MTQPAILGFDSMPQQDQISSGDDVHGPELLAVVHHRMSAYGDSRRGVVGDYPLLWLHRTKRKQDLFVTVESLEKRPSLPTGALHLLERLSPLKAFADRASREWSIHTGI